MEQTKRIILIAFSVFTLLFGIYVNDIQYVSALSHIDLTVGGNNNYSDLVDRNSVTGDPCRLYTLTTAQRINAINCDTHVVFVNNATLGSSGTACNNLGLTFACNIGTGTFSGLECNRFACFTSFSNASANLIVRYLVTNFGSVSGYISNGVNSPIEVDGLESATSNTGNDITLWYAYRCSAVDTDRVIGIADGTAMTPTGTVDGAITCATASGTGGNLGANNVNDLQTAFKGTTRYLSVTTNQAVNNFRNFRLDTNAFVCMFSGVTSNKIGYDNDNTEWLLVANAVSGDLVRIENDVSCTNNGTVTDVTLGTTGASLQRVDVNEARNEIFISASGSKLVAVNTTSYLKVWEYALSGSSIVGTFAIETNATEVVGVSNANIIRFIIITAGSPLPPSGTQVCIDTNNNGVADLCFIDTDGDGIADCGQQLCGLGGFRSTANFTEVGSQWFCAFGVGSCTDTNPKTNGVGLFYLMLLIVLSYAFLVFIHYSAVTKLSGQQVQVMDMLHINPILLLVMLIIDLGITWKLGWIDDTILALIVVAIAGLTSFGFLKKFRGGGT